MSRHARFFFPFVPSRSVLARLCPIRVWAIGSSTTKTILAGVKTYDDPVVDAQRFRSRGVNVATRIYCRGLLPCR